MMITVQAATDRLAAALGNGPDARLAASALIEADALRQPRFGIAMLDEWAPDAASPPRATGTRAIAWHDCTGCFAPLAVASATLDLERTAKHLGIAAVFLRGVRGFGRFAPFMRHLADSGLAALAGAEGPPFVTPFGGDTAVVGTNPLAFGIGQGDDRVIIDAASSTATMADIRTARESGSPLPKGVAVDADGIATCNAGDVAALLPRGGQIGSLVALIVELLAGVTGGGRDDPKGRGTFLIAIDPSFAEAETAWQEKLTALRRDWTDGGGHWPKGGGVSPDAPLDDTFEAKLADHIRRLTQTEPRA